MTDDHEFTDAEVEQLIGDNVRALEEPPEHVFDGARAAFGLRSVDVDVADLLDQQLVRDDEPDRAAVAFGVPTGEVSVEVGRIARAWRLTGTCPIGTVLVVRTSAGSVVDVDVDGTGYFDVEVPASPGVVVRLEVGGTPSVATPWMP